MKKYKIRFSNQTFDNSPILKLVKETKCYLMLESDVWSYRVHKKTHSVKMRHITGNYGVDLIHNSYLQEI